MKPALGNPLAIGGLALTALNSGDKIKDFTKKNWKWILGAGAVAFGGYLVYDKYFSGTDKSIIPEDTRFPSSSLTKQEAAVIAEELFQAMTYHDTDFNRIKNALTGLTYNDFAKVSAEFGMKYYDTLGGTEGIPIPFIWPKLSLHGWLSHELEKEQMAAIQNIMPNVITTTKGITIGSEVMANKNKVQAKKAEKVDGVWYARELNQTYNQDEVIGEVIEVIRDPYAVGKPVTHLVVDKPWNWNDVIVEVQDVIAI